MVEDRSFRRRLQKTAKELTGAERRLVNLFVAEGMAAVLLPSPKLAEKAEVSTPTVVRLARKLGYDGFSEMQSAVREEVAAQIKKPATKLEDWHSKGSQAHLVHQFAETATANIGRTLDGLDLGAFEELSARLADVGRPVFIGGGRITRSVADHLANHLQMVRGGVTLLEQSADSWPRMLLDLDERATLILFDIRRYQKKHYRLGELARKQKAAVALFTDQWVSPIDRIADWTLPAHVEAPSSWDSTLALHLMVEALVADVARRCIGISRPRIERLEQDLDEIGAFDR